MKDDLRGRAETVFKQAIDLPPHARDAFVDSACADDRALCDEVRDLLVHFKKDDLFLEAPLYSEPAPTPHGPERLGPYRILRVIGEGGMGIVYEAEQDNPRRTVALKVIRPGVATQGVLTRFQREAHILGRLRHHGIAQIYEAGAVDTPNGPQPYFAMELIEGPPLIRYVAQRQLDTRDRLELVAKICDAVQHAHEHGVIHRDLKPANILVVDGATERRSDEAMNGDEGKQSAIRNPQSAIPKILDFGVARITQADMAFATLQTDVGQLVGTISYMSPEQVSGDPRLIDNRTDVYSLGVILYELLAGRLPHDVRGISIPEAARIIRENEPSRLSSIHSIFRGDIETIVAKAMERDPARRYQSIAQFADDLRRYLRDEPIVARPASRLYQFRKFAKRHKGFVGGTAATLLVLIAGLIGVLMFAARESRQRQRADDQSAESQRLAYRASISAAQAALASHNAASARRSLEEAPAALRGWEWKYFRRNCDQSILTIPADASPITEATFAGNDQYIVTGHRDGRVRLHDAAGKFLRDIACGSGPVDCIAVSPDGTLFAAASHAAPTWLGAWEIESARELWRHGDVAILGPHAFSADGSRLALGTHESCMKLLDVRTGGEIGRLPLPEQISGVCAWSPDSTRIVASLGSYASCVVDAANGHTLHVPDLWNSRFTNDGRHLLARDGSARAVLTRADVPSADNVVSTFAALTGRTVCEDIAGDGVILAAGEATSTIVLRDTRSHEIVAVLQGLTGLKNISFSRDGTRLLGVSGAAVKVWHAAAAPAPFVIRLSNDPYYRTVHSPASGSAADSPRAAGAGWGGIRTWNTETGAEIWSRMLSRKDIKTVAWSPDAARLAAVSVDHRLFVLDATDGQTILDAGPLPDEVRELAWSRDADRLLAACADGLVRVLDPRNGDVIQTLRGHERAVTCVAVSSDGHAMATGGEDGAVRVWNPAGDWAQTGLRACGDEIASVAFSGDGARLAATCATGHLMLWRLPDGDRLTLQSSAAGFGPALSFSPDRSRVAAAGMDGTIHLWDADTGSEVVVLRDIEGKCTSLAFAPDGDAILAGYLNCLARFETGPPSCGYDARELVRRARDIIESRFKALGISEDVVASLEGDADLSEPLRSTATILARARGNHVNWLNSDAWGIALYPNRTPTEYGLARRKVEAALRLWPEDISLLNTLGVVEFRMGELDAALATLARSVRLAEDLTGAPHPIDLAVLAMTQHRLGRPADASAALEYARRRMSDPNYANDSEARSFLREAEELLKQN